MVVRLSIVALGLLTFTACSGQSGTEKDGGPGPCEPSFPVPDDLAGTFFGAGLEVEVEVGEAEVVCTGADPRYEVPISARLFASWPGIDDHLVDRLSIGDPAEAAFWVDVPVEASGSTWTLPEMEEASDVSYTYLGIRRDGEPEHPWTWRIGWRGLSGERTVEGEIGTWTPSRL